MTQLALGSIDSELFNGWRRPRLAAAAATLRGHLTASPVERLWAVKPSVKNAHFTFRNFKVKQQRVNTFLRRDFFSLSLSLSPSLTLSSSLQRERFLRGQQSCFSQSLRVQAFHHAT